MGDVNMGETYVNSIQKNEICSIFKGYKEINFDTDLVLFNKQNQHIFIDYKEFNIQEIEDFLVNQSINKSRLKDKKYKYNYDYDSDNSIMTDYTLGTFFSKCAERFGEKRAKILSNLLFYCRTKFNMFHFGHTGNGTLHCDIIVPNSMVEKVRETFNLIFYYRYGKREHIQLFKLTKGVIFQMNIVCFYHYFDPNMFIYKTKLLSDDDFIKVKKKLETIGKWKPERIDNPELNPMHPDAPPFPIWNKRFEEINPKDY